MRATQRRKLLLSVRDRTEPVAAAAIYNILQRRYAWLKRDLRRANLRKRIAKAHDFALDTELFKENTDASWDSWINSFGVDLQSIFTPVVTELYDTESKFWLTRNKRPAPVDPASLFEAYQLRTGRKITSIGRDTETDVLSAIHDWYNTDASLPELIDQLSPQFGMSRAESIARTESTYITSQVSLNIMHQFGVQYWNWDLADEDGDWPCSICVALAQGNPYKVGDPMPPDNSHVRCRCGTVPATEDGGMLIFGADEYASAAPDEPTEAPANVYAGAFDSRNLTPAPALPSLVQPISVPSIPSLPSGGVGGVGIGALDEPTNPADLFAVPPSRVPRRRKLGQ